MALKLIARCLLMATFLLGTVALGALLMSIPNIAHAATANPQTCNDISDLFVTGVDIDPDLPDGTLIKGPVTLSVCGTARVGVTFRRKSYTLFQTFNSGSLIANPAGFPQGTFLVPTPLKGIYVSVFDISGGAVAVGNTLQWNGVISSTGSVERRFQYSFVTYNGPPESKGITGIVTSEFRIDINGEPAGQYAGNTTWSYITAPVIKCYPGLVQSSMYVDAGQVSASDIKSGSHIGTRRFGFYVTCPVPGTTLRYTSDYASPPDSNWGHLEGALYPAPGSDTKNVGFIVENLDPAIGLDFSGETGYPVEASDSMVFVPLQLYFYKLGFGSAGPGKITTSFTVTVTYP